MAGYPVTHGYTINIVKDKTKPAFILLNPPNKLTTLRNINAHSAQHALTQTPACPSDNETPSDVFYIDKVVTDNPDHITEVAHEEVVEDVGDISDMSSVTPESVIQCDICNTRLVGLEEARLHMVNIHNMVNFEGPCFKCDFCNIFVTDRVSHMKTAHYSALAQEFVKRDNSYHCRQCDYSSDQLTNIRNHVDAKHGTGENKYVCEECQSQYRTLNSMRAHKSRVHVKRRKKTCQGDIIKAKLGRKPQSQSGIKEQILALELKTLPSIVRGNDLSKFIIM